MRAEIPSPPAVALVPRLRLSPAAFGFGQQPQLAQSTAPHEVFCHSGGAGPDVPGAGPLPARRGRPGRCGPERLH
eukprot:4411925-Pyramimonas_sp.AAC.1